MKPKQRNKYCCAIGNTGKLTLQAGWPVSCHPALRKDKHMKSYKDFSKWYIGISDVATLIMAGFKEREGFVVKPLPFGQDDNYHAYIVKGEAEIGKHYEKVEEFTGWLKIYDDTELAQTFEADKIIVYRAGEMGCIIQLLN